MVATTSTTLSAVFESVDSLTVIVEGVVVVVVENDGFGIPRVAAIDVVSRVVVVVVDVDVVDGVVWVASGAGNPVFAVDEDGPCCARSSSGSSY